MKKFTHVKCLNNILLDGIVIFRKDKLYKIVGSDNHYVYYVEPEYYEDYPLPDEFAITPLNRDFEFLVIL